MATSDPLPCENDRKVVLMAIDGSEHSQYAFNFYVDNIHRPGYKLILVHCAEYGFFGFGDAEKARKYYEQEEAIKALVERMDAQLKSHGVDGCVERVYGEPGHSVCEKAKEEKVDCIVTGCRGLGKIRRTMMGSVSDYILHHSHVPVMVCRTPDQYHSHHHRHHHHHKNKH